MDSWWQLGEWSGHHGSNLALQPDHYQNYGGLIGFFRWEFSLRLTAPVCRIAVANPKPGGLR